MKNLLSPGTGFTSFKIGIDLFEILDFRRGGCWNRSGNLVEGQEPILKKGTPLSPIQLPPANRWERNWAIYPSLKGSPTPLIGKVTPFIAGTNRLENGLRRGRVIIPSSSPL